MSFILDRIIIGVHDLEAAMADYTALGFIVQRCADDPDTSISSAVALLDDGVQIELLSWRAPSPQQRRWQLFQRLGEGIVDFVLRPSRVDCAASKSLQRLYRGDPRVHGNGVIGVASLAVAVHDLDRAVEGYRALLGDESRRHVGQAITVAGSPVRQAVVDAGGASVVLLSPRNPLEDECSPLAQRLALRGEGAYGLVLRTINTSLSSRPLDLLKTHGVLIELELVDPPAAPITRDTDESQALKTGRWGLSVTRY